MFNGATKKEFHMLLMSICLFTVKIYIRPSVWSLCDLVQRTKIQYLAGLPHFNLYPAGETSRDRKEWGLFLTYLMSRDTVKFIPTIHAPMPRTTHKVANCPELTPILYLYTSNFRDN